MFKVGDEVDVYTIDSLPEGAKTSGDDGELVCYEAGGEDEMSVWSGRLCCDISYPRVITYLPEDPRIKAIRKWLLIQLNIEDDSLNYEPLIDDLDRLADR